MSQASGVTAGTGPAIGWDIPPLETGIADEAVEAHSLGGFRAESDLALCLLPLLKAFGWRGNPRYVAEALPHFADSLDLTGLRNAMASLGYTSRPGRMHLREVDPRLMPCLYVPTDAPAQVLLRVDEAGLHVFDAAIPGERVIASPEGRGDVYFFQPAREDAAQAQAQAKSGWVVSTLQRFRPLIWQTLSLTFFSNILALATPLFIMAVYDRVVASGSTTSLIYLVVGFLIALMGDMALRTVRARIIAFMAARTDHIIGMGVFERLLYLAPTFTERSTVGSQVARLNDFESVREFFIGPLAMVFFEAPFVLLHLAVIAVLGGTVAVVPFIALFIFVILGVALLPLVRSRTAVTTKADAARQELLVESFMKMQAIKEAGAEEVWLERYRKLSAEAAYASFGGQRMRTILGAAAQMVVVLSGLLTMGLGTVNVLAQDMSVGALIACMILVWRVLAPLQTAFMTVTQLEQIRSSVRQVDQLMTLKPEHDPAVRGHRPARFRGRVVFNRVSLRYTSHTDPALVGVSFTADAGEVVAIVGPNGAGKSTLLKLIAGMYTPQAGNVQVDDIDIRQLDPVDLRAAIGYVPQQPQMFYGTIAQNMRLAYPTATDVELRWAAEQAGCLSEIDALREGFETRIGEGRQDHVAAGLAQRISLARAYLKRSPVMLFDEPANGLDFEGDRRFTQAVEGMRGHSTVFIVTHRPSHLKLADRILVLDKGYVRLSGPREQVIDQIPKELL